MSRRIRITVGDTSGEAELNEAGAPETVRRFWDALPIQGSLRHLRWGGEGAYILIKELSGSTIPIEDPVSFYPHQSLALRPEHGEFVIAYGQAQARSHRVAAAYATRLGRLTTGGDALADAARRTLAEGATPILIERAQE